MRDRFGIFGAVIKIRKLSLLLVMTLRIPNNKAEIKCMGSIGGKTPTEPKGLFIILSPLEH